MWACCGDEMGVFRGLTSSSSSSTGPACLPPYRDKSQHVEGGAGMAGGAGGAGEAWTAGSLQHMSSMMAGPPLAKLPAVFPSPQCCLLS
ncbi:hypothetical protein E2C01_014342 [Portunus trituberculatus]|uniref:Uncharacterized protein n=1 Tax=Portunus trituberculatus TaxID=210409 RepID=A0A5B7DJV4_PORTR|nr:hypothetical protein [Portunus trituberculatus]